LNTRIQEQALSLTPRGSFVLQDFQRAEPATYSRAVKQSHAIIVLLSQGSMKSAGQLQIITSVMSAAAQLTQGGAGPDSDDELGNDVSSVTLGNDSATTSFWMEMVTSQSKPPATPSTTARGHACPVIVPVFIDGFCVPGDSYYSEELPGILQDLAGEARPLIQAFFRTIALRFSTGASDHVLEIQSREVLSRIPKVKYRTYSTRSLLTSRSAGARSSGGRRAERAPGLPTVHSQPRDEHPGVQRCDLG
jgi:hypothetical protein